VPDVATLIANADSALYAAKQAGRNRIAAFGLPIT
jgi:GGDEF domain-containing protein